MSITVRDGLKKIINADGGLGRFGDTRIDAIEVDFTAVGRRDDAFVTFKRNCSSQRDGLKRYGILTVFLDL